MVLDVDPGQPEYSPPGVISLCKITTPNLSPSFCHPTLSPAEGQVRAHAIASVTPAQDPAHFIECVLDLFAHYQQGPDAKCPLVINTPGWIQGTGLDILTELITSIQPTEVIYMSQDGPDETVNTLRSACTATTLPTPFSTLPSQPNDSAPARTSLHFRTMQTMSYFHLAHQHQTSPLPSWDPTPLTALRPWRVRYAGPDRGFLGILCYDHQPAPDLLAEAINGTVLALVKVENRAAAFGGNSGLLLPASLNPDTTTTTTKPPPPPQDPKIPLIPNPQGLTLPPRHSRFLCLVLVRGIDPSSHELQLLTPLPRETVASLAGSGAAAEQLVLVAGRFDTPSWAYSEDLYLRAAGRGGDAFDSASASASASTSAGGVGVGDEDGDGDDDQEEGEGEGEGVDVEVVDEKGVRGEEGGVPWVEMLHGSQRRAVGSKVWRVRRDLGRG